MPKTRLTPQLTMVRAITSLIVSVCGGGGSSPT